MWKSTCHAQWDPRFEAKESVTKIWEPCQSKKWLANIVMTGVDRAYRGSEDRVMSPAAELDWSCHPLIALLQHSSTLSVTDRGNAWRPREKNSQNNGTYFTLLLGHSHPPEFRQSYKQLTIYCNHKRCVTINASLKCSPCQCCPVDTLICRTSGSQLIW